MIATWCWARLGRLTVDRDGELSLCQPGGDGEDGWCFILGRLPEVDRDALPARDRADFDTLLDRWRDASRPGF